MKPRIIKSTVTAILSLAIYPLTNCLAVSERGYQAIGGEEALLIFGLAASLYILAGAFPTVKSKGQTNDNTDENNENN